MRGLLNLGNTCFFNTAIQCLAHVPPLTKHLFETELTPDCKITLEYQKVVKKLFLKGIDDPVDPSDLLREFRIKFPSFNNQNQHDAQEVIFYLIDIFEKSIKTDIFNGYETQEVVFPDGKKSQKTAFTTIFLDVNGPSRLEDLVKEREKWVGIKDYIDDSRKQHHVAAIATRVETWPRIVSFSFSMYNVKFPIEIPFHFLGRKLFACIIHHGIQQGGHYALMVLRDGKWFIKDDESVIEVPRPAEMKGAFYMVLYR